MRKISRVLFLYFFVFVMCMGATFAWYAWQGEDINVDVAFSSLDKYLDYRVVNIDDSGDIITGDGEHAAATMIEYNKKDIAKNLDVYGNIYLVKNSVSNEQIFLESNLTWVLYAVKNGTTTTVSTGNFVGEELSTTDSNGVVMNSIIPMANNILLDEDTDYIVDVIPPSTGDNLNLDISGMSIGTSVYSVSIAPDDFASGAGKTNELYIRGIKYGGGKITEIKAYSSVEKITHYMITTGSTPTASTSGWKSVTDSLNTAAVKESGYVATITGVNHTMTATNNVCVKDSSGEIECKSVTGTVDDKISSDLCVARTYTGSSQQLTSITGGTGYTLSGYNKTNAGTYTITATLNSGYEWVDGSTTNKTFNCSIKQKSATVTAGSSEKVYDGTPLTNGSCSASGLVSGHTVSCTMTANSTITNVGTVDNVINTTTIKSGTSTVTSNYDIKTVKGTLKITPYILEAPKNLKVSTAGIVTWDNSTNATGYQISINNSTWSSATSGIDYLGTITGSTGSRTVYVRAVNSDTSNYTTPSPGAPVTVSVYKVTLQSNSTTMGTLDTSSYNVISGAKYSTSSNKLTFTGITSGTTTKNLKTVTATNKTGYHFDSWSPASGTVTSETTITGNFAPNPYTITIKAGNGISKVALSGWTNTGTATMTKDLNYLTTLVLSTITPTYKSGYSGVSYTLTSGSGTISGTTFTVGVGAATITLNATTLAAPVPSISTSNVTKIYGASSTTLTATQSTTFDSAVKIYYKFGNSDSSTGTYSYGSFATTTTSTLGATNHYGRKYYKVQGYATDGTLTSSTATWNSSMYVELQGAPITFNANSCGTLSAINNPIYAKYNTVNSYTTSTGTTAATKPTFTVKTGYTFTGWYSAASGGSQVLNTSATFTGTAVSGYTTASAWAATAAKTLYAQCTVNSYTITVKAGNGISKVALSGWTNTGTGTMTKSINYGTKLDLSTITPTYKNGYSGVSYTKTSGSGSISGTTFTVGASHATITLNATTLAAPVPSISTSNVTKIYGLSSTTLTATQSTTFDSAVKVYYKFGNSDSSTGTYSYGSFATTTTSTLGATNHYGTKYYKVQGYATDGTLTSSTATWSSSMYVILHGTPITLNANSCGTLSGTTPFYAKYNTANAYTTSTGTTAATKPTFTVKTGYTFTGWYSAASGGSQVLNTSGTLNGTAVSGYTTASAWVATAAKTLYAQCTVNSYTITVKAGNGISKVALSGWTNTGTGTMTKSINYGTKLDLSTITPTYKNGYSGVSYTKTSGSGTINGTIFTVGVGSATITLNATTLAAPVPSISTSNITKIYGASSTPLTATQTTSFDSAVTVYYKFGNSDSSTGTYSYGSFAQNTTYTLGATNHYGTKYYKVQGYATDGTLTSSTATWSSSMYVTLHGTPITLNANSCGTISGTTPFYAKYNTANAYTTSTGTTAATKPTFTVKTGYTFNGWYTATSGGSQVLNTSGTLNGTAVSGYTTASAWAATAAKTLYAQCTVNSYTITVKAGNGISKVALSGWTNTGTGTMTKSINYGTKLDLSTITPTYKNGYSGVSYTKTSGSGSISGTTFTVGASNATITLNATTLAAPTPSISTSKVTKIYGASSTTLTATQSTSFDSAVKIYYKFGNSDSSTGTYSYGSFATTTTSTLGATNHYGTKYYKVQAYATDGTLTSGTATWSSSMYVTLQGTQITFNANNCGTIGGTNPMYVKYNSAYKYTTSTGTTAATTTFTAASGYTFLGWYTATSGGSKVLNTSAALTGTAVSGYTTASAWIATEVKTLYAQCVEQVYEVYNSAGASIGYTTNLSDAVSSVPASGTIKPLKNNSSGAVTISKNLTLNTNGKTITMTGVITTSATVTISGTGTITAASSNVIANTKKLTVSGSSILSTSTASYYGISNTGTLSVSGGTISGRTGIYSTSGSISISGGKVIGTTADGISTGGTMNMSMSAGSVVSNGNDGIQFASAGTFSFSGGTVDAPVSGMTAIYVPAGYSNAVVNVTGGKLSGATGFFIYSGSGNVSNLTIDTTSYNFWNKSKLSISSGNFSTGGTISTVNEAGTTTISGGTFTTSKTTCTSTLGCYPLYLTGGELNFNGGSVSKYIRFARVNGGIFNYGSSGTPSISVSQGIYATAGTVNIKGGTLSGSGSHTIQVDTGTATVNISGGKVASTSGNAIYSTTGIINISNGTVTGSYGVNLNGGSTTISGGSISGDTNGIYSASASTAAISISGGKVSAVKSDAINHFGKGNLTITGGTVTAGTNTYATAVWNHGNGVFTLGKSDSSVSTTAPRLNSSGYNAVSNATGTWNYYDGVLYTKNNPGYTTATAIVTPSGYSVYTTSDSTYGYKSYLLNTYTITYYNGSTKLNTSTHSYGTAKALTTWSALGGTITNSSYGWSFAGWSTSTASTTRSYTDGQSVTDLGSISLYAVYKRTINFKHGSNSTSTSSNTQYWNPYGTTSGTHVSGITSPTITAITSWNKLGFRNDTTAGGKEYNENTTIYPAVAQAATLYGVYSRSYSTTLYSAATTQTASCTAYYNSSASSTPTSCNATAPSAGTLSGWTTLGWRNDTTAGAAEFGTNSSVSTAYTYYAVYSRNATFYSNANKSSSTTSTQYYNIYGSYSVTTPGTATMAAITNWTKLGWRDDATSSWAETSAGSASTSDSSTFYAVYSRTLTVSYAKNNSSATGTTDATTKTIYLNSNSTATSYQAINLPSCGFALSNYSFNGWSYAGVTYAVGADFNPAIAYNASSFSITMNATWYYNYYQVLNASGTHVIYKSTLADAILASSSGYTIKVLSSATSSAATISKNVTLNTNGKTLTMTGNLAITASATITGSGNITSALTTRTIYNSGTLTISGGTINNTSSGNAIFSTMSKLIINGGYITSTGTRVIEASGTMTMDGGTVATATNTSANRAIQINSASTVAADEIFTMTGGYISTNCYGIFTIANLDNIIVTFDGGSIYSTGSSVSTSQYCSGISSSSTETYATTFQIWNGKIYAPGYGIYVGPKSTASIDTADSIQIESSNFGICNTGVVTLGSSTAIHSISTTPRVYIASSTSYAIYNSGTVTHSFGAGSYSGGSGTAFYNEGTFNLQSGLIFYNNTGSSSFTGTGTKNVTGKWKGTAKTGTYSGYKVSVPYQMYSARSS